MKARATRERCPETVAIEATTSSGDGTLKMTLSDLRRCRMAKGHRGDCRFKMYLNANGRIADAEVRWRVRR